MPTPYNRLVQLLAVSLLLFSSVRSLPLLNQETPSLDSLASYAARDVILEKRGDKDGGLTAVEAAPLGRLSLRNGEEDKETSQGKVRKRETADEEKKREAKEAEMIRKGYAREKKEKEAKEKKKTDRLSVIGMFAGAGGSGRDHDLGFEANKKGGEFSNKPAAGSKKSAFNKEKERLWKAKVRAEVAAEMAEEERAKANKKTTME